MAPAFPRLHSHTSLCRSESIGMHVPTHRSVRTASKMRVITLRINYPQHWNVTDCRVQAALHQIQTACVLSFASPDNLPLGCQLRCCDDDGTLLDSCDCLIRCFLSPFFFLLRCLRLMCSSILLSQNQCPADTKTPVKASASNPLPQLRRLHPHQSAALNWQKRYDYANRKAVVKRDASGRSIHVSFDEPNDGWLDG